MTAWRWGSAGRKGPDYVPERPGEPDQRRRGRCREGAGLQEMVCGFLYAALKGSVVHQQANVEPRDGNVAVITKKRLGSLQTGCSDKLLPAWPIHLAVGWRTWGLVIGCLSVFTTWQPASPRVSEPALSR